MKLSFNTNIGSLKAQNQLLKTSERLGVSLERLSSGLRINRASDDPAGLSIANALAVNTLSATVENYAAAESRIMDADIAHEVAEMIRQQNPARNRSSHPCTSQPARCLSL